MTTTRALWLLALTAMLGLMSCADRTPVEPVVAFGPSPLPAPTPPTPATPGDPPDSLLEANRALWNASGIESYRYRFGWECFCGTDYLRVVDIIVVNGAIESVLDASTGRPVSEEAAAYYRTIDGLFDYIRAAIDRPAASVRSVYDMNLGYPADTFIDYAFNWADDEIRFRIYGLSPLDPQ